MLLAAAILSLLTLLLSLPLTLYARRGKRLDTHPTCRHCRFDLHNKPATSTQCPECGQHLTSPKTIRIGNRAPRTKLLLTSLTLALLSLYTLAFTTHRLYRTTNPWHYVPAWYLTRAFTSSSHPHYYEAQNEINRRLVTKELSRSAQLHLLSAILTVQDKGRIFLDSPLGKMVESLHTQGSLTADEVRPYILRGFRIRSVTARPLHAPGDPLAIKIKPEGHYHVLNQFTRQSGFPAYVPATLQFSLITPGGLKPFATHDKEFFISPFEFLIDFFDSGIDYPSLTLPAASLPNLPPGPVSLLVTVTPHLPAPFSDATPQTFQTTFTQVASPAESLQPVTNPAAAQTLQTTLRPTLELRFALPRTDPDNKLRILIPQTPLPEPVSYDVILRTPTSETTVGSLSAIKNIALSATVPNPDPSADTFDFLLRPSRTAASTLNQTKYLDAPLLFRNLPVRPPPTK